MNICLMKYNYFNKSYNFNKMNICNNKKVKNNSRFIRVLLLTIIAFLKYKISNSNQFKSQKQIYLKIKHNLL